MNVHLTIRQEVALSVASHLAQKVTITQKLLDSLFEEKLSQTPLELLQAMFYLLYSLLNLKG
jgi:hypothetical protein